MQHSSLLTDMEAPETRTAQTHMNCVAKAVRIFVKFGKQAAAMKAYIDLDGRYFGGRHVWVCFYKEVSFDQGHLAPTPDEPR